MWSTAAKRVLIIKPWRREYQWHKRSSGPSSVTWQRSAEVETVGVGCRGFLEGSEIRLLRAVGVTGSSLRRATKELA